MTKKSKPKFFALAYKNFVASQIISRYYDFFSNYESSLDSSSIWLANLLRNLVIRSTLPQYVARNWQETSVNVFIEDSIELSLHWVPVKSHFHQWEQCISWTFSNNTQQIERWDATFCVGQNINHLMIGYLTNRNELISYRGVYRWLSLEDGRETNLIRLQVSPR